MFLLFVLLALSSAALLPPYTSFNFSNTGRHYIVNGTVCSAIYDDNGNQLNKQCGPSTLVVDPPNERLFFDLGNSGGKFAILSNDSYTWDSPTLGTNCAITPGFGYDDQVTGYLTVVSRPGSKYPGRSIYTGLANDAHSCDRRISATINTQIDFITELDFSQRFPIQFFPNTPSICATVVVIIELSWSTLDDHSSTNPYFVIPASCNTPIDFCQVSFPSGNPCDVCS